MKTFLDVIFILSCSISILSAIAMSLYFLNRGMYTYWELQWKVLWLEIVFRYRDHTKVSRGRVGVWFHIFRISIFICIIVSLFKVVSELRGAPVPIIFIVALSAILLLPLIGYAIYNMSKETYYHPGNSDREKERASAVIQKMNLYKAVVLTTVSLFFLGLFPISSVVADITESALCREAVFLTVYDPVKFKLSIGLLFALSSPVALSLAWAYSRRRSAPFTFATYYISLLFALACSFVGPWIRLIEMKDVVESSALIIPSAKISIMSINYATWGIGSMIILCLPIVLLLYRRRSVQGN